MSKLILNPDYQLYECKGQPFCDSLQVAETFGKRHDNVVRDIETLNCSTGFRLLNFEESSYRNQQNKRQPMHLMTKDGFMFLVMGYRGKKAALIKEAYINRFNAMESFIKSLVTAKLEYPALTEAVMNAHDEPKHYHFSNEINMINRIVIGMTASQFKADRGLDKSTTSIRPYLNASEVKGIQDLQRIDVGLIVANHDYEQRKTILTNHYHNGLMRLSA